MQFFPASLQNLSDQFARLPGIGGKTAQRLAFHVLEMPLEEAQEMLGKAGFAFSHANKFDIIVEYFIAHQNYNIFEINEALFAFDQSLLGG